MDRNNLSWQSSGGAVVPLTVLNMATVRSAYTKKGSDMATVRDTTHTLALFEGRAVLDPDTILTTDWEAIIHSVIKVMSPKHLHGFLPASAITATPLAGDNSKIPYHYVSPPARIWLGRPGDSDEFKWSSQHLLCAERSSAEPNNPGETISVEYLLFGRDSRFFILSTLWYLQGGEYHFSNNTRDGELKVRQVSVAGVVSWCQENAQTSTLYLRGILEAFLATAQETEKDLAGKLERAAIRRKVLEQRLSRISWVKSGS